MLALILSILGVVEADPNLLIAALAGASGPTVAAMASMRGTRGAVAALSDKMDLGFANQSRRIDDLYAVVAGIPKATNTKVVQQPSGETVVTVTPHEDIATLVAQAGPQRP